jgi:hypothetical protein
VLRRIELDDRAYLETKPGFISTQLHRGIAAPGDSHPPHLTGRLGNRLHRELCLDGPIRRL